MLMSDKKNYFHENIFIKIWLNNPTTNMTKNNIKKTIKTQIPERSAEETEGTYENYKTKCLFLD